MGKIVVFEDSFQALTDMRTHQYAPVKLHTTAPFMSLTAEDNEVVLGILQDKPNINEMGRVMILGRTEALVDGSGTAITAGDWLGLSEDGVYLVKKTSADDGVCAQALAAASIAGAIIDVMLLGMRALRTFND